MRFLIICLSLFIASPAIASDVTVEMLNKDADGNRNVYSQEIVEIAAGSTVKWVPTDKLHNVEIIASPNDMKLKSKNSKEVSVTFETPGIYYYWCTPHKGMGMIGLVIVGGDTSNKTQISKAKAIGKSKKKLKALLEPLS